MPTLASAYDEYTFDAWNGVPDFYADEVARAPGPVRECTIEIPDRFVEGLFKAPELPVTDWQPVE
jgi:hypothetical protein